MESMIQSSDLTALDNADIRDAAYTDFFSEINKKMTYKITRNRFDIQNGTASVTAHITYIDGTNFTKRLSLNFSVRSFPTLMPETSLQKKKRHRQNLLLFWVKRQKKWKRCILRNRYHLSGDQNRFGWKIVSLDDETVKIM